MDYQIALLLIYLTIGFVVGRSFGEISIEKIAGPFRLSEGPHWDSERNVLYFVDIPEQNIYCFHPETKLLTHTHLSTGPIGVAVPVLGKSNIFIAGSGTKLVELSWDSKINNLDPTARILATVDIDRSDTRFNDGKVDPRGRFWAGTMGEKNGIATTNEGALYRFSNDGTPTKILASVSISNGLTWSHNNDTFYYIDSPTREIASYSYNNVTGDISGKRIVFDFQKNNISGMPDGMTIDRVGNLWIAVYDGGRIIEVEPKSGKLLRTVSLPVTKTTSVCFGGPQLNTMYVTSAREGLSAEQLEQQPLAGSVFAVHGLDVTGSQMLSYKIN